MRELLERLELLELLGGETEARDVGEKRVAKRDVAAIRAAEKRGEAAGGKPNKRPKNLPKRGFDRTWVTP